MPHRAIVLLPILALAACTSLAPALDDEVISSMTYDTTPCPVLVERRNVLAGAHGLPRNTGSLVPGRRPFYVVDGTATMVPDMRLPWTRARSRAIGEVKAMDGSINRRKCLDA